MAALGEIGTEVLRAHNIAKIEPSKQYSYEIRRAIHSAAFDRFGEAALYAFGFNSGYLYPDWVKAQYLLKTRSKGIDQVDNSAAAARGLNYYVTNIIKMWDEGFRNGVQNGNGTYGCKLKRLDDTVYLVILTSTSKIEHESFQRGALDSAWAFYLTDTWDFDTKLDEKNTLDSGSDWTQISLRLNFSLLKEPRLIGNWSSSYQRDVDNRLLITVLNEAKKQSKKIEILGDQLKKYVPPQIHQALLVGRYDTGITTRRKKVTIFFSDIKNFTSTSENLQPEDLTKYLNEYFSEMTQIALDHGATIDKYIGDAMMVFFGDPETKGEREDARACVEMALNMRERMSELQSKWSGEGFADPFQVRMGINTGYCNVGNFGSDQRLTYTIIGGEVNVAARMESSADANGILMSYETYAHCQDFIKVEQRQAIKMKGINRDIKIFSVLGRNNDYKRNTDKKDVHSKSQESQVHTMMPIELRLEKVEKQLSQLLREFSKLR